MALKKRANPKPFRCKYLQVSLVLLNGMDCLYVIMLLDYEECSPNGTRINAAAVEETRRRVRFQSLMESRQLEWNYIPNACHGDAQR